MAKYKEAFAPTGPITSVWTTSADFTASSWTRYWRVLPVLVMVLTQLAPTTYCLPTGEGAEGDFDWGTWWGYDGISGPSFWGVINRGWRLCSDGKRQSPINLPTDAVVFDHNLLAINTDSHQVEGKLTNTGFGLRWTPSDSMSVSVPQNNMKQSAAHHKTASPSPQDTAEGSPSSSVDDTVGGRLPGGHTNTPPLGGVTFGTNVGHKSYHSSSSNSSSNSRGGVKKPFTMTGGPFHYKYALSHITLRWSASSYGSEHSLQNNFFPAEVQLFFYNTDLYRNFTEASDRANGVAAIAVFLKEGWRPNPAVSVLLEQLHHVPYRGSSEWTQPVPIRELFTSNFYLSYEGSLTEPPCEETVTWALLNKPAYITPTQLESLQLLRRGSDGQSSAPSVSNVRPTQPLNSRAVRTNIPPYLLSCYNTNRTAVYQAISAGHS